MYLAMEIFMIEFLELFSKFLSRGGYLEKDSKTKWV